MSEYISREELLEKEKYLSDWNIDLYYIDSDDVKMIPSADVRPNIHAEWEKVSADKYIKSANYRYRCSMCGELTIGEPNFCPTCGADMRDPKGEKGTE